MSVLSNFTSEDVFEIVRQDLGVDVEPGVDPTISFDDLGVDSLGRLELLTVLETGITIPDTAAGELLSVADALGYLKGRLEPEVPHGHTDNQIDIAAPLDLVWDVTNDVAGWPELFSEYAAAEILQQSGTTVRFRLTMHPDDDGQTWSWVSERSLDRDALRVTARRVETGPFEYMDIVWTYESIPGGTRMRWVQDFHMKPGAPVDDAGMTTRIDTNTPIQMARIQASLEAQAKVGCVAA
jgi:aromatase